MTRIIQQANESVRIIGRVLSKEIGIGTTLSIVRNRDEFFEVGHVGDSKVYLLDDSSIECMVPTHVLPHVSHCIKVMRADGSEWSHVSSRTVLERYIGQRDKLDAAVLQFLPTKGQRILICSDGISSSIDEDELLAIHRVQANCNSFLQALAKIAHTRGGCDNATGISIRCI